MDVKGESSDGAAASTTAVNPEPTVLPVLVRRPVTTTLAPTTTVPTTAMTTLATVSPWGQASLASFGLVAAGMAPGKAFGKWAAAAAAPAADSKDELAQIVLRGKRITPTLNRNQIPIKKYKNK